MGHATPGKALLAALLSGSLSWGAPLSSARHPIGLQAEDPAGWERIEEFEGVPVEEYRETDATTGRLLQIGTRTLSGEPHGPEWSFWPNGAPHIQRVWVHGKLDGPYCAWFKSGIRRLEGRFDKDGRVGVWRRFVESGTLITESEHAAGELHGAFREFYTDGKPKSERHFEHGVQSGPERRWGRGGGVVLEGNWLAGEKHGVWKETTRAGRGSKTVGVYERGLKEGVWSESTLKGQKLSEVTYVADLMEGVRSTWRPDGSRATESHFVAGKETGPAVAWYRNGQKQLEGRKIDGKREGAWTYWKEDGSIDEVFTGTYEGDVKVPD